MKAEDDITRLKGIAANSAEYFYEEGFFEIIDFEDADFDDIMKVKYMQEERAEDILQSAENQLEKKRDSGLYYDPGSETYHETEPENYTCNCKASFPQKSVFLAHCSICDEASL